MRGDSRRCAVIACDVFQHDAGPLLQANGLLPIWLEMGLHDQPDMLRSKIQQEIHDLSLDASVDEILLLYGACGNGLVGVASAAKPLLIPQGHDCLSVLLGGLAQHEKILKEHPGIYFYTPGWVRGHRVPGPDRASYIRATYREKYPDDDELVEDLVEADATTFENHGVAGYVELERCPEAEDYCQRCAAHLGWKFLRLEGDASLLSDFLSGVEDPQRFLRVPPFHRIQKIPGGQMTAIPVSQP